MSAPDWQLTVLHELGVTPAGLISTGTTAPVTLAPRSLSSPGDATVVIGRQQPPPVQPSLDDRTLLDFRPPPVPAPLAAPVLTPGPPPWATTEPAARPAPTTPGRHALPAAYNQPEPTPGQQPATTQFQTPGSPQPKHHAQATGLQTRPAAFGQPAPTHNQAQSNAAGETGDHRAAIAAQARPALEAAPTATYNQVQPHAASQTGRHTAGTKAQAHPALDAAPTATYNQANPPTPSQPAVTAQTHDPAPHQLKNPAQAAGPPAQPAAFGQPATEATGQAQPNTAGQVGDHTAGIEAQARTAFDQAPNAAFGQADGAATAQAQPNAAREVGDHAAGIAAHALTAFGQVDGGTHGQAEPGAALDQPAVAGVPVGHNHPPVLVGGRQEAEGLVRRAKHGDPLARRVGRGMRRMVGAHAGQDKRELDEAEARLRQPVSTCRQIAFTSIRGGAGKTTVASLVAQTIAEHRDGRTLAIDADPGLGSLPLRLGADAVRSLRDIAASQPRTWEEAEVLLSRTGERLWVSPATSGRRIETELELPVFNTAVGLLSRYFSVAVMDCGAGLLTGLHRGILDGAHGQVLVTPGTVDGALSARGAIDWFRENGLEALLSRTVVALVSHTPHEDADIENARKLLSDLPVFHLPYDRHLSAGSAIDPAMLSESVRSAAVQISVAVFSRATLA